MWDTSDPSHYYQSLVVPTPLLTEPEKSASGLLGRLATAPSGYGSGTHRPSSLDEVPLLPTESGHQRAYGASTRECRHMVSRGLVSRAKPLELQQSLGCQNITTAGLLRVTTGLTLG